jgi:hypothetical protein
METACTYFTRRALQERSKASHAGSAEARKAHLELALRLVRVATDPALSPVPEQRSGRGPVDERPTAACLKDVGNALAGAFPLRPSSSFEQLLEAVDTAERDESLS